MVRTVRCGTLRGRIDLAIITIREDEFEAVLKRFTPYFSVIDGVQLYSYCEFRRPDGDIAHIAITRSLQQGHASAQSVARTAIDDLEPRWLALVGIAGGVPDDDFTLGDVMLASSLHDFAVNASVEDEPPTFRTTGGPVHPKIERLLALLPSWKHELGDWFSSKRIGLTRPRIEVSPDLSADCYYGDDAIKLKVQSSLRKHFEGAGSSRDPRSAIGALATSNTLVKSTKLLNQWRQAARQLTHIEMEAGGVYFAARHARASEIPLLSVRGLSDVVGFKRSPEWTEYACHSAASFVEALLSVIPLEIIRSEKQRATNDLTTLPKISLARSAYFRLRAALEQLNELMTTLTTPSRRSPTVEAITAAFERSSYPPSTAMTPHGPHQRQLSLIQVPLYPMFRMEQ